MAHWQQRAFSLIEIIMVLAVIAILATLAIPSQVGTITQKRIVETIELLEPYKPMIAAYYHAHNGEFPEDNAATGLPAPDKIVGNYLRKMEVRDGVMHLYLGQKLPEKLHNKIVSLRPVYVPDSPASPISWICGYNTVPSGMKASGINLTDLEKILLPGRCR